MEKNRSVASLSSKVAGHLVNRLPEQIGSGGIFIDTFASGLRLLYCNQQFKVKVSLSGETTDWWAGISFSLKGHSIVHASTLHGDFAGETGKSRLFFFPGTTVLSEDFSPGHRVKINIMFDAKVLFDCARDDEEAFLPLLQGFKDQAPYVDHDIILPRMHQALNQILVCPYTGKTRDLFLESKVMELITYKLEQIRTRTRPSSRQHGIPPYDIERIRHAARCLLQNPADPPDITTLAAAAGMSRSKFYKCFKQVFGHSPLDHLRNHRLQLAQNLLTGGKHNVTETAFAVGYNNLSHFTKIFTAEFGVPPHKMS